MCLCLLSYYLEILSDKYIKMFPILINTSLLINLVNWARSAVKQCSTVHARRTGLFSPLFPPKPHPAPSSWLWFSLPSRLSSSSCSLSQESDRYPGLRLPPRTPALSVTSQSKKPQRPSAISLARLPGRNSECDPMREIDTEVADPTRVTQNQLCDVSPFTTDIKTHLHPSQRRAARKAYFL